MTCDKCTYFKVLYEPLRDTGVLWDMGRAVCDKHNLITDFANHGKFKRLDTCEDFEPQESEESDHKCHDCKHYMSGEQDGSCDSYICEHYSAWESEDKG